MKLLKDNKYSLFSIDTNKIILRIEIGIKGEFTIYYINKQTLQISNTQIKVENITNGNFRITDLFYLSTIGNNFDFKETLKLLPIKNNGNANIIDLCNFLTIIDSFIGELAYLNSPFIGSWLKINLLFIHINLIRKMHNKNPITLRNNIDIVEKTSLKTIPILYPFSLNNNSIISKLKSLLANEIKDVSDENKKKIYNNVILLKLLIKLIIIKNILSDINDGGDGGDGIILNKYNTKRLYLLKRLIKFGITNENMKNIINIIQNCMNIVSDNMNLNFDGNIFTILDNFIKNFGPLKCIFTDLQYKNLIKLSKSNNNIFMGKSQYYWKMQWIENTVPDKKEYYVLSRTGEKMDILSII